MNNDELYDEVEKEIARLQNENYASPEAQRLLDWEAEMVLQDYLECLVEEESTDVLIGEIVDQFDFVTGFDLWLDE